MDAGAGDRLGLKCEHTGEGLPVAVLPYCGRPLLESLIRDVQAREYLYYKLHGVQQMTPIAIMTSDAKDNHRRVTEFMNQCDWFGRGKESFRYPSWLTHLPMDGNAVCHIMQRSDSAAIGTTVPKLSRMRAGMSTSELTDSLSQDHRLLSF